MGERYVIKDRWIFDTKLNKNIHSIDCYEEKSVLDIMNGQDQRIAELEEQLKNAIVPKFKKGQEVWTINKDMASGIESGILEECSIQENGLIYRFVTHKTKYSETYNYKSEDKLFATKEEAQAKLEELRGK
jgi:hypothetical protein